MLGRVQLFRSVARARFSTGLRKLLDSPASVGPPFVRGLKLLVLPSTTAAPTASFLDNTSRPPGLAAYDDVQNMANVQPTWATRRCASDSSATRSRCAAARRFGSVFARRAEPAVLPSENYPTSVLQPAARREQSVGLFRSSRFPPPTTCGSCVPRQSRALRGKAAQQRG
jgi:hypothetical protein